MKKILKFIGFLAAMVLFFFIFVTALMLWQLTPIINPSKYQNVVTLRWHDQGLIKHFPEGMPPDIKNTQFYYRAGFLQGGASIELRVKMHEHFVESVYAKYQQQAKAIYNGADKMEGGINTPNKLPKGKFFTFSRDEFDPQGNPSLLPHDFDTLLLHPKPYKTNPTDRNHGQASGISISRQRREIIYWAEDW